MLAKERQEQFEAAVLNRPETLREARIARNFGFSNSARIIEGGLFACTSNLENYSKNLAEGRTPHLQQFIFLCVLTFPPHEEVYFAVLVRNGADKVNRGLLKLYNEGVRELAARPDQKGKISNNVKFYITESGELYFHNHDFRESLRVTGPDALDPDCLAEVDSILFAIWPPTVSAQRSQLTSQLVDYLGELIGHEKIQELRVWTEATSLVPEMRPTPKTLAVEAIEAAVIAQGGYSANGEVRRIHAALNYLDQKHFVILTGLSGTGKTQLAMQYARAVHGLTAPEDSDALLFLCPVRPDWTDPTGLTGHVDLSNRYVVPDFLQAVLAARAYKHLSVFVVLDEMNLAPVEYYFSDVLSAMETKKEPEAGCLHLHYSLLDLEGSTGTKVPRSLPLPPNLYIIGTVNVDETTHPISDKVLDRAMLIDMSAVNIDGFLNHLVTRDSDLQAACDACRPVLTAAAATMAEYNTGFGYRIAEEVVRYHAYATARLKLKSEDILDDLMVQKVLIKLRGGERHRPLLTRLTGILLPFPRAIALLGRLTADLDELGSFQVTPQG